MSVLICDMGVNHFCYTVFQKNVLVDVSVLKVPKEEDLLILVKDIHDKYNIQEVGIESPFRDNVKNHKYATLIITYFKTLNLERKTNIITCLIPAVEKFKKLNLNMSNTFYKEKKQKSIDIGESLLSEKIIELSDLAKLEKTRMETEKIKFDDFYDCVLMYYTRYLLNK